VKTSGLNTLQQTESAAKVSELSSANQAIACAPSIGPYIDLADSLAPITILFLGQPSPTRGQLTARLATEWPGDAGYNFASLLRHHCIEQVGNRFVLPRAGGPSPLIAQRVVTDCRRAAELTDFQLLVSR